MISAIRLSQHCLTKIEVLREHGFVISGETIVDVVQTPEKVLKGYRGRLIAQKRFSSDLLLRVVYEIRQEESFVVTVYPARKSRYEKDSL